MSLTVTGLLGITSEAPEEKEVKNGSFFNFEVVSADKSKEGVRHKYIISVIAYGDNVGKAREELKKGRIFLLRAGYWQTGPDRIQTDWRSITILDWFPKGRKNNE
jgi:hypothetical protein